MKKTVFCIMICLVLAMAGCSGGRDNSNSDVADTELSESGGRSENDDRNINQPGADTEPQSEAAAAEPPADTASLKICTEDEYLSNGELAPVIEQFKILFPDVEVVIDALPSAASDSTDAIAKRDAAVERIQAEVMAGKGPDLFLLNSGRNYLSGASKNLFEDIEKTMRAGVFCDLNPLILADPSWNGDAFYKSVVESCSVKGRQYIFPLNLEMPVILTTEENLQKTGFDLQKASESMDGFLDEVERCIPSEVQGWLSTAYYSWLSYPLLNYDTGEVYLGPQERAVFEWSQKLKGLYAEHCDEYLYMTRQGFKMQAQNLIRGDVPMVSGLIYSKGGPVRLSVIMADLGEDAAFLPIPDEKGGVTVHIGSYAAIRANSENQKNSYEFLKLLLSEEMMMNGNYPEGGNPPIRKGREIVENFLLKGTEELGESGGLSQKSMDSLYAAMERVNHATIQQIWYVPVEGETSFNDIVSEYTSGLISYSDFVARAEKGLKFYWGE